MRILAIEMCIRDRKKVYMSRGILKTAIEAGDKSNMLCLSTEIDKSKASSESIIKAVNKPAGEFGTLEKIIFSPFGNQLILRSDKSDNLAVNLFAVCDDDGNYIEMCIRDRGRASVLSKHNTGCNISARSVYGSR